MISIFQYLTGGSRPLLQKLYNKSAAVRKGQKYPDQIQTGVVIKNVFNI